MNRLDSNGYKDKTQRSKTRIGFRVSSPSCILIPMPKALVRCNAFIRWGFYLLFGLVPLLLTPLNYELFEYNKMMAVYALTILIGASWLTKALLSGTIRVARTPLDIPIALFTLSQFISGLFSIDPHVSWFGYYSRFNGGLWSVLSYVVLYYAFLSNPDALGSTTPVPEAKRKAATKAPAESYVWNIRTYLLISLSTAVLVAIYGVLERLGIDKNLWVQDVQNRVFSTLGQPNWLAAYLISLVPVSMAFGLAKFVQTHDEKGEPKNAVLTALPYGIMSILFFLVLLFTRSRSGLLGFVAAEVIFWGSILTRPGRKRLEISGKPPFLQPAAIMHVAFVLIVAVNGTGTPAIDRWVTFSGWKERIVRTGTTQVEVKEREATASAAATGPALEVGGTESGTIRKYVWQGAINAWKSTTKTLLIGTGTETFAFAFYQFRPQGHNLTSEWDFLYNKAHNEYLNYLATTGIFGLGSYLFFIGTFVWWFIKNNVLLQPKDKKKNYSEAISEEIPILNKALFAGWLSILITNFFGFSVVILQVFLFLFPAFSIALSGKSVRTIQIEKRLPAWLAWPVVLVGLYGIIMVAVFWYADTLYAKGYRLSRSGLFGQAVPAITSAIALNPNEPLYRDEISGSYATLAVAAFEGGNSTQAAMLANAAIAESDRAIATAPHNVNFYKTRTKILYTLSALDPSFNGKAVEALTAAIPLSPNDPKIFYNLAILAGREGTADKSIEFLKKAIVLKKNYRDAYYALWVFYTEENKPKEANAILTDYLKNVDPNDKDFQERIR